MLVRRLNHYNVLTTKLDETNRFYERVLGMRVGPPPSGDTKRGAWIYDGEGTPVVHVQAIDPADPERRFAEIRLRLGEMADGLSLASMKGTGVIEHIAFECTDYDRVADRLREHGLAYRTNEAPMAKLRQLFVKDPNGITLELNFATA